MQICNPPAMIFRLRINLRNQKVGWFFSQGKSTCFQSEKYDIYGRTEEETSWFSQSWKRPGSKRKMLCGSQEGGLRVFRLKLTEYEASSLPRANYFDGRIRCLANKKSWLGWTEGKCIPKRRILTRNGRDGSTFHFRTNAWFETS